MSSGRGRGRGYEDAAASATRDTSLLLQIMELEARRDFLAFHVKALNQPIIVIKRAAATVETLEQQQTRLQTEISTHEEALKLLQHQQPELKDYIQGVLLRKFGQEKDGISTRIANHFAPLTEGILPFVSLETDGLRLYWNNPKHALKFAHFISAHQLTHSIRKAKVPATPGAPEAVLAQYQSDDCTVVSIPHLQVEAFLKLAQYHSYSLKAVASDLYAAKKFNRGELVTLEALASAQPALREHFEASFVKAVRVPLDAERELVRVSITADVKPASTTQPRHVIVLFDDSGSMDGDKIVAANEALKEFVKGLDPDTLVSIQPFNAKTVAFRQQASELQAQVYPKHPNPHWCSIPATGGTPLVEILANSAVFLRDVAANLAISEDAIRNATVVLLTDGQANGAAKTTISAMQTSHGAAATLLDAVSVPGVTQENYISYGLDGFSCRVLPVIFPISIGRDSDQQFMHELASSLHMPEAFVSTGPNMQTEINEAMGTLEGMLIRVPQVFVGLGFEQHGLAHAVGTEEHNVFNQRERVCYFTVPAAAQDLRLCTAIDNKSRVVQEGLPQTANTDATFAAAVINEYVAYQLMEMKVTYSSEVQALSAGLSSRFVRGGTRGAPAPVEAEKDESAEKFSDLKARTLHNATALKSLRCSTELQREIDLFITQINSHQSLHQDITAIAPTRAAAAQFTQSRVGKPVVGNRTAAPANKGTIFELINSNNWELTIDTLLQNPALVNSKSQDQYGSTPLISAIVKLNLDRNNIAIQRFIQALVTQPEFDPTLQDLSGNTALHRAAWYGLSDLCFFIIENSIPMLNRLKRVRNDVGNGAMVGETILDNIRRSPNLNTEQKKQLQREFSKPYNHSDIHDLSTHTEPFWNTRLMELLRELREDPTKSSWSNPLFQTMGIGTLNPTSRQSINFALDNITEIEFLESNFDGDTALHYAIWFGEFAIAQKIIEKTPHQDLPLLLSARNSVGLTVDSGGETPLMNLALAGKRAYINFILYPQADTQRPLQEWLVLCTQVSQLMTPLQQAELNHLMQVYGKGLEGYSSGNFLKAAPVVAFMELETQCQEIKALHPTHTTEIDTIQAQLSEIKNNFVDSETAMFLQKWHERMRKLDSNDPRFEFYRHITEVVERFRDHVNGDSATLIPLVEDAANVRIISPQELAMNQILAGFNNKIAAIGEHHHAAKQAAEGLLTRLRQRTGEAFSHRDVDIVSFKRMIHDEIIKDLPILQRDLGWGDYLQNLAKQLVNALTWTFSFGSHQGFFTLKSSDAVRDAIVMDVEVAQIAAP